MSSTFLWKLKSAADNQFYSVWLDTEDEPSVISFNGTHAVVPGSGKIIKTIYNRNPTLGDEDGRLMVAPVIHPDYMNPYFTSEGDDYDNGTRGGGNCLAKELTYNGTDTTHETTVRFADFVHIVGGKVWVSGAKIDDYIDVTVEAPASPVTSNGSNTGNCNLLDLSGGYDLAHLILPAAGDGTHDVNITEPMNANLAGPDPIFVSKVVPIPAVKSDGRTPDGFWEYDVNTGEIIPCPEQNGKYNLYDFPITLTKYINKLRVFVCHDANYVYQNDIFLHHRSGPFLPHWYIKCIYTTANTHNVNDSIRYNVMLMMARRKST